MQGAVAKQQEERIEGVSVDWTVEMVPCSVTFLVACKVAKLRAG